MFKNFFRGVASINAGTYFEKARLQATYNGDTSPPNEEDLQTLLKTLNGNDTETKATVGFQTIVNKLKTSDSRKYWNYLMKNLVILDRAVDEGLFCRDVAVLQIPGVDEYNSKTQRYKERKLEELVAAYFRFIKDKADVNSRPRFSLTVAKNKRKEYFKVKDVEDILEECRILNSLYISAFEVFHTGSSGHLKYKLNQYVFLLVLNSIMNILSTQYVAFIVIIETYFDMDLHMANECHRAFKEFLKTTEDLISFTGAHQFIPGFQISLHELRNPTADAKLLNSMQEYIKMLEEEEQLGQVHDRKATEHFTFNAEELQPKKSEINFADFANQFQGQKLEDDDEVAPNETPLDFYYPPSQTTSQVKSASPKDDRTSLEPSNLSVSQFSTQPIASEPQKEEEPEPSSQSSIPSSQFNSQVKPRSPRNTEERSLSPQKSNSIRFEKAFEVGFFGLVSLDENAEKDLLSEYKVREEEQAKKQEEAKVLTDEEKASSQAADKLTVTPAFKKLLVREDEDAIFDHFDNFFSDFWDDSRVSERKSQKEGSKLMFTLKPCGVVLTECDALEKKDEKVDVTDFKQEIFSGFKNLYSSEFKM